ncbi:MAG: phytanoyl-CoA dioxygenase family protein [Candidatus Poribacteria bacterium]|nr:phytanoyl-CoA dioxygenase family protein [Candidatus Poribacteria bacterium]
MNADERYLFDLMGYVIIPDVLTAEEVKQCNQAIDHHIGQLREMPNSLAGGSEALAGTSHRKDMGGMLSWDRPWCEPFRQLLIHPNVSSYLETILGKSYRLDHGPGLIAMDEGTEGGTLHGGGIERPNFSEAYFFKDGRIYCGLTVVEFMLADEGPGDGGLGLIPGSHKANLSCPRAMKLYQEYRQYVVEVHAKAGDAVVFTETLTHGTLPWKAKHQRRALLYKFSPGFQAYSQGAHQVTYPDYIEDMTPEERAVMEAPHIRR